MDYTKIIALLTTELLTWGRYGIRLLPRLALAIIITTVALFVSQFISRWVRAGLLRVSGNGSLATLMQSLTRVLIVAVGFFVGLGVLGLEKTVASLLAGAGVLALAVGFAFQDLTTNFISGTAIALGRPLQVGDTIETNGFTGKVMDVKLRSVILDNGQGQTVEIPSKDIFQKPIINYSRSALRRIDVQAGVSYLEDLPKVQQVAQRAVEALPFVSREQPVTLYYRTFADNNIQFVLWFWVDPVTTNVAAAQSEAIMAIREAFQQHQILMVFAGHTFDLRQKLFGDQPKPDAPASPAPDTAAAPGTPGA